MKKKNPSAGARRRRLLPAAVLALAVTALLLSAAELVLRGLRGEPGLYAGYRWLCGTHLVDPTFSEFRARQEEIQEERAAQGMERGRDHPLFGWTYNPGFHASASGLDIRINSHALRGPEFPEEKPPGEIRVLALGGSTTAGEEVAEADTYPAQLEQMLRERFPGKNLRVINAGVPSYHVEDSFRHYSLRLFRLRPDFVTIYHGINDVRLYGRGGPDIAPKQNYSGRALSPFVYEGDALGPRAESAFRWLLGAFADRSQLVSGVRSVVKSLEPKEARAAEEVTPAGIAAFQAYAGALVRQIQASSAVPVLATFAIAWPGRFDEHDQLKIDESFRTWLKKPGLSLAAGRQVLDLQNRFLFELAAEEGIPACDVAAAVPADREHFIDVCHLTPQGNRRIAAALADTLAPLIAARR
ncbi:MAG: SGNH/GDSL hydrolase family protein [Planctomycetes bacterium]|nr:SGNH/GDSL hydrolase family protein [Planctomycetota bacterium]